MEGCRSSSSQRGSCGTSYSTSWDTSLEMLSEELKFSCLPFKVSNSSAAGSLHISPFVFLTSTVLEFIGLLPAQPLWMLFKLFHAHTSPRRARLHSTLNLFSLLLEPIVLGLLYSSGYFLPQSNLLPWISDFTRVQLLFNMLVSLCNQLFQIFAVHCVETSQAGSSSPFILERPVLFISCHLWWVSTWLCHLNYHPTNHSPVHTLSDWIS